MKTDRKTDYLTRQRILTSLTDDEVAKVSNAETAAGLPDGDEYLDLEKLTEGVQRARGTEAPMGRVLPRKAVQEATWSKLLKELGPRTPTAAR
jgi:hypothetical protein